MGGVGAFIGSSRRPSPRSSYSHAGVCRWAIRRERTCAVHYVELVPCKSLNFAKCGHSPLASAPLKLIFSSYLTARVMFCLLQVLAWSDYALETYSNAELIAINQDSLGSPAFRIVGTDLTVPCNGGGGALASVTAAKCSASDPMQAWTYDATSKAITLASNSTWVLDAFECGTSDGTVVSLYPPDNGSGTCGGKNQQWLMNGDGTITNVNSLACLDIYDFAGPGMLVLVGPGLVELG